MLRPEIRFSFLIFVIISVTASKCPQSRKPHPTNCFMFYNCVNLPGGGYVWVPYKCTEGLVFESYLQTCVLPSETWSCDSIYTESTVVRKKHEAPEVTKMYLDINSDPLNLSEMVDSSHFLDSPTDGEITEETTPYSLNEEPFSNIATQNESKDFIKKKSGNFVDDESSEKDSFPRFENKTLLISSVTWLDRIIDKLLIHQSLNILSDETFLVTNSGLKSGIKTKYPTTHKTNPEDALHNHFVTNYIIRNNFENEDESLGNKETKRRKDSIKYGKLETTTSKSEVESTDKSLFDKLINEFKPSSSIISIKNHLGGKQYLTMAKYEFLKDKFNPDTVDIIPCSSGERLANNTDCTKYYICEAKTASVGEFSCPSYTAFNERSKICDTQTYSLCKKIKNENLELNPDFEEVKTENVRLKKSLCQTVGKVADPSSLSHYYLCYSNSGKNANIESMRMMCPNNLIFCAEKKVCATEQFCTKYNFK